MKRSERYTQTKSKPRPSQKGLQAEIPNYIRKWLRKTANKKIVPEFTSRNILKNNLTDFQIHMFSMNKKKYT